ncbi:MAG: Gfo/Idh/MocA family oxidoreductase, partial [Planctomycetes bacterium]|nr:Gfo/Idh/MocA family oxidoreductase [Planctomycetota bacterium]
MSRRHRIALVGCGDIAETGHLPALLAHPRFELVAACDIRPERARLLAGRAGGIRVLTDYRALVEDRSIDAVVLALHPEHSVDAAIAFLGAGTAVLDEKPLACTLADGERVA